MNWKFLFFSLKGRISRKDWWIGWLLLFPIHIGLSVVMYGLLGASPHYMWNEDPVTPAIAMADAMVFVILLRPMFALDIKRIHDRGLSAYFLVPAYLGWLLIIALEGLYVQSFFDLPFWQWIFIPLALYEFWLLFELGLRKGTRGPGKYGADPREPLTDQDTRSN